MRMEDLILEALQHPGKAIGYFVGQQLADLKPHRGIIETDAPDFNLAGFAAAQHCRIKSKLAIHNQVLTRWHPEHHQLFQVAANACYEIIWQDYGLEVLVLNFDDAPHYWIMADTQSIARTFFSEVCAWQNELQQAVLVFERAQWQKSTDLFQAIQTASLADVALAESLKQDIVADVTQFFAAYRLYQSHQVPWKRSILLAGSPGNGKTHLLKALMQQAEKPCLYVKTIASEIAIQQVFERARRSAPCLLVLEGIEALLQDAAILSAWLTEWHGLASNAGILILATTRSDRLDLTQLAGSGGFDRVHRLESPDRAGRASYLSEWNQKLAAEMQLSAAGLEQLTEQTAGFSVAALQDLMLSAIMQAMQASPPHRLDAIALAQAQRLRSHQLDQLDH